MKEALTPTEVSENGSTTAKASKRSRKGLVAARRAVKKLKSTGTRPYPRRPLEKAIRVAVAIKDKNGGNPWSGEQLAKALNISHKGPEFVYHLLSSRRFGLTDGTQPTGQVSLTALGRELVYSGSADQELAAKRKAFLSVDIFKQVLEFYNGSTLPEMQYLANTLQAQFKLHPDFHEEFSQLFKQNCRYVGLESGVDGTQSTGAPEPRQGTLDVVVLSEPRGKSGLSCFVIMPFLERSGDYPKGFFDEVLNSLIIPAARDAGFEVKTANRQGTEIIHATIINEVIDADICLCDLTEHNPNVLFELGMRLPADKPVALVHAEGTARVFDVDNVLRVFPYKKELWRTTLQGDIPDLTAHIKATWDNRDSHESYYKLLRGTQPKGRARAAGA